jgi:hypothetical protein
METSRNCGFSFPTITTQKNTLRIEEERNKPLYPFLSYIVSFAGCRKVGGNFDVTAAEPGPPFCLSITVAKWPFGLSPVCE